MLTLAWLLRTREQSKAMDEEVLAIQTRRPVSRCHEDLDTGGGALHDRPKKTTATGGEDEAEQSLWLALLAGKVEALGQSSQSKCESWRLKGHFPSSSPVWRGAIWQVSVYSFTSETTSTMLLQPHLISLKRQIQTSRVDRDRESNGNQKDTLYKQGQEDIVELGDAYLLAVEVAIKLWCGLIMPI